MGELRFDGRTALITGGGRGLGRAHALLLAGRGARVIVNDPGVGLRGEGFDENPATSVAQEIILAGGEAVANFDSVASAAGAAAMIAHAISAYGRIDIVINNAGIFLPERDFAETSSQSFTDLWAVHLMGSINVIRAAWPYVWAQRYGRIVNTTSHVGYLGCRGMLEYSVAKAGLHGLTRSLAHETDGTGITINAVAPGAMTRPVADLADLPESFGGPAHSADLVAPTVAWLAHESCTVNGEIFGVMAGTTSRIRVAETIGFRHIAPTIELVRDNFHHVMDEAAAAVSPLLFPNEAKQRGGELIAQHGTP